MAAAACYVLKWRMCWGWRAAHQQMQISAHNTQPYTHLPSLAGAPRTPVWRQLDSSLNASLLCPANQPASVAFVTSAIANTADVITGAMTSTTWPLFASATNFRLTATVLFIAKLLLRNLAYIVKLLKLYSNISRCFWRNPVLESDDTFTTDLEPKYLADGEENRWHVNK